MLGSPCPKITRHSLDVSFLCMMPGNVLLRPALPGAHPAGAQVRANDQDRRFVTWGPFVGKYNSGPH